MNTPWAPAFRLLTGAISTSEFEGWLYGTDAQSLLPSEVYLSLIDLDYRDKWSPHTASKLLRSVIDPRDYEVWRVTQLMNQVLAGGETGIKGLIETYTLCTDGYGFLDNLAIGYGLSFYADDVTERTVPEGARVQAARVIRWLETGQIVLGEPTENGRRLHYTDHRRPEEKVPKSYFKR